MLTLPWLSVTSAVPLIPGTGSSGALDGRRSNLVIEIVFPSIRVNSISPCASVTSNFLLVNTRDKDIGTIWEAGFAFAHQKPIVYFCAGLPEGAKFNLMLARSGIKVCTSFEDLEDYLDRCYKAETLIVEQYDQEIE